MKFLREVFSDGGQGSYSRVASGVIVFSTIVWITYLVIKNKIMPDLSGPTFFMGAGTAVHYGANKVPDILSAFKGNGNGQPNDGH